MIHPCNPITTTESHLRRNRYDREEPVGGRGGGDGGGDGVRDGDRIIRAEEDGGGGDQRRHDLEASGAAELRSGVHAVRGEAGGAIVGGGRAAAQREGGGEAAHIGESYNMRVVFRNRNVPPLLPRFFGALKHRAATLNYYIPYFICPTINLAKLLMVMGYGATWEWAGEDAGRAVVGGREDEKITEQCGNHEEE
ncbi:hypothetical protein SASPL_109236 [Salvia splendens]|uniref:Uncharacterized protein n=1 Tax=Salvia splendens TaxID=180675 RepID=A0A8X8YJP6_SALSN|nr:hypothetical protein SASPL_109236 [Salvia splendens]